MKKNWLIFDLSGTLVKMRPPVLLIKRRLLFRAFKKYNLGIITGAKRPETINILKKLNILFLFKKIVTKDDYIYSKPDKKLFKPFNIKRKAKSIYLGDTKKDWQLSKNANIPFCYLGKKNYGTFQNTEINQIVKLIVNNFLK